ncbi:MAG TPA: four helix bundle protein [Anaerolineaceae bacterium]|jgi:four helix bundle protein|nr:four helix bundle protein [Anaerolineaceae bacterium]
MQKVQENSRYKDLLVWQKSLTFADQVIELIDHIETSRNHYRLFEQLESAVTSVPMNIAEGKGRNSSKEFMHFFYIARGSLYETLTLLEIFKLRSWITNDQYVEFEQKSNEIAKMINSLISVISRNV